MTNAEKYCPNSNISELENLFRHYNNYVLAREWEHNPRTFREFLKKEAKLTLTENERVILRNINEKYIDTIRRNGFGELILHYAGTDNEASLHFYDHLFKFIKERRRI